MSELARRKVVLIQIDSGSKEIQTGGSGLSQLLAGLSPAIFRPFQALNNASYTNAELAVEQYDLALKSLATLPTPPCPCDEESPLPSLEAEVPAMSYPAAQAQAPAKSYPVAPTRPPIPAPAPEPPMRLPLILRARLTCNQAANIMTAWTLGPEDKAQVLVQFLIEWEHQLPCSSKSWKSSPESQFWPQNPPPGSLPGRFSESDLALDYQSFVRGQKLVDRARAEFYQAVTSPAAAVSGTTTGGATLPIDEAARQDIKNYERLFPKPKVAETPAPTMPPPPAPPVRLLPSAPPPPVEESLPPAPPVPAPTKEKGQPPRVETGTQLESMPSREATPGGLD